MRVEDYNAMISSVADIMSAPDYFPATMPENDLHPDPARLQGELIQLRHRVQDLETRMRAVELQNAGQSPLVRISDYVGQSRR